MLQTMDRLRLLRSINSKLKKYIKCRFSSLTKYVQNLYIYFHINHIKCHWKIDFPMTSTRTASMSCKLTELVNHWLLVSVGPSLSNIILGSYTVNGDEPVNISLDQNKYKTHIWPYYHIFQFIFIWFQSSNRCQWFFYNLFFFFHLRLLSLLSFYFLLF